MKKILLLISIILLALISLAGIDQMDKRDPGMPPNYDYDTPGNGNGNGNNPNVPIDDNIIYMLVLVGIYGVYNIKKTVTPIKGD